jgi:hypothetical protein
LEIIHEHSKKHCDVGLCFVFLEIEESSNIVFSTLKIYLSISIKSAIKKMKMAMRLNMLATLGGHFWQMKSEVL